MISIICVYNNEEILNKYLINSLNKQDTNYELITIDNRSNKFTSATSALNYGAKKANGNYLMFVHQDINLIESFWIKNTIEQIKNLENPGVIGVAGKINDNIVHSNIKQGTPPVDVSPFKLDKAEHASTLDECLLIILKEVYTKNPFNEKTCPDWHLYGTDYVLDLEEKGYYNYIIPTTLEHRSKGDSMSEGYYQTIKLLQKKYRKKKLIRTCMGDWFTFIPTFIQRIIKKIYPY